MKCIYRRGWSIFSFFRWKKDVKIARRQIEILILNFLTQLTTIRKTWYCVRKSIAFGKRIYKSRQRYLVLVPTSYQNNLLRKNSNIKNRMNLTKYNTNKTRYLYVTVSTFQVTYRTTIADRYRGISKATIHPPARTRNSLCRLEEKRASRRKK